MAENKVEIVKKNKGNEKPICIHIKDIKIGDMVIHTQKKRKIHNYEHPFSERRTYVGNYKSD